VSSLPKTVTRQRRGCDLNPGSSAPESSTLTTRLPSHPNNKLYTTKRTEFGDISSIYVAPAALIQTLEMSGARFTKCLTIYHKIIVSLSKDRLTIVTYSLLRLLLGIP